jgi:predicted aspartyl protease
VKQFRSALATASIRVIVFVMAAGIGCAAAGDPLGSYLSQNGYGSAPLVHPMNFYHLRIRSNGNAGSLIIDAGAPNSLVFRSSLKRLGLIEEKTNKHVAGAFGRGSDVFGLASIKTLTTGNCTFTDVPIVVANGRGESMLDLNRPDGALGLHELIRYGSVLDFKNRLIYFQTSQKKKNSSGDVRSILLKEGYTPVPLSIIDSHLQVRGSLNGVPCRLVVDTGAFLTGFSSDFITRGGFKTVATPFIAQSFGSSSHVRMVKFASLRIENYEFLNGSATVVPLNLEIFNSRSGVAGLIGAEYLGMNWAVFDFTNGTMYLHPRH